VPRLRTLASSFRVELTERAVALRKVQQWLSVERARLLNEAHHDGVVAADEDLVGQALDVGQRARNQRHVQRSARLERRFAGLLWPAGRKERSDIALALLEQTHAEGAARDQRSVPSGRVLSSEHHTRRIRLRR